MLITKRLERIHLNNNNALIELARCLELVHLWTVRSAIEAGKNSRVFSRSCLALGLLCDDAGCAKFDGAEQLRALPSQEGEQAKTSKIQQLACCKRGWD